MNEYVESKVGPPGIALMVFGGVCILFSLLSTVGQLIGAMTNLMLIADAGFDPELVISFMSSTGIGIISTMMAMLWAIFIIVGGNKLRNAQSPALVYAACFFMSVPCCTSWCCCFGLPLAGWAIMTMQDEQVAAAFAEA